MSCRQLRFSALPRRQTSSIMALGGWKIRYDLSASAAALDHGRQLDVPACLRAGRSPRALVRRAAHAHPRLPDCRPPPSRASSSPPAWRLAGALAQGGVHAADARCASIFAARATRATHDLVDTPSSTLRANHGSAYSVRPSATTPASPASSTRSAVLVHAACRDDRHVHSIPDLPSDSCLTGPLTVLVREGSMINPNGK